MGSFPGLQRWTDRRFTLLTALSVDVTSDEARTTAFTGPAGGFTVQVPAGKNGTMLGIDYGYRATNPFGGVHSIGVHVDL